MANGAKNFAPSIDRCVRGACGTENQGRIDQGAGEGKPRHLRLSLDMNAKWLRSSCVQDIKKSSKVSSFHIVSINRLCSRKNLRLGAEPFQATAYIFV
jgi:hypothetical protein